jgi:diguanylate cyclase (GGDEF)-like protein
VGTAHQRALKHGLLAAAIGVTAVVLAVSLFAMQPYLGAFGGSAVFFGLVGFCLVVVAVLRSPRTAVQRGANVRLALSEATHDIISMLDADELFAAIEGALDKALGPSMIALYQCDRAGSFRMVRSSGAVERPAGELRVIDHDEALLRRQGTSELGDPASAGIPPFSEDLVADLRSLGAALVVPLAHKGACAGIAVLGTRTGGYSVADREALVAFTRVAATAVENARLYGEAITDGLTRLAHRKYFLIRVGEALEGAKRYHYPVSVLLADIDGFRSINDGHGHAFGDRILKEVAAELRTCCRESDIVARYRGDSFAILLHETAEADARRVADRMRRMVSDLEPEGIRVAMTIGVGFVGATETGVNAEELMQRAEAGLGAAGKGP